MKKHLLTRSVIASYLVLFMVTGCYTKSVSSQDGLTQTPELEQPTETVAPETGTSEVDDLLDEPLAQDELDQSDILEENFERTIWVNNVAGNDQNSGASVETALKSITAAVNLATPGVEIRIAPGIYRESIKINKSGTTVNPIMLIADEGLGSVVIRGSESSSSLTWTQLTSNTIGLPDHVQPGNIYFADLSSWKLTAPPRYLVMLDENDQISTRYMPAREPDFRVDTEWKYHEFWWAANGGHTVATCNPTINPDRDCDLSTRSYTKLTDNQNDSDPAGIEQGNLTTFGNLTGATLVAMDAHHAHYMYRSKIISSNPSTGRITVEEKCEREGEPGLGWGSKYYVENHPALLDQPGEWWFDQSTQKLYFWSPEGQNPASLKLEISRWDFGFDASNQSYVILDGFQIELFNQNGYQIVEREKNNSARGNRIRNSLIHYVDKGIVLYHYVTGSNNQNAIIGFRLEESELSYLDSTALDSYFGWYKAPTPETFTFSGIRKTIIRNNEFHHIGFNSSDRSAVGIRIFFPDQLTFEGNHVHDIAQNGMHIHLSLINSTKTYGFTPVEIKIGEILIKDNVFEKTCQAASDCSAFKIGGSKRPDTHVFREVLITGNTFRHVFGWSYVSTLRRINTLGDGNGFYLDYASGVHFFRNIAYNNTGAGVKLSCLWRDGDAIFYNNVLANNYMYGIKTTGMGSCDNHNGSVRTRFVNNIFINNGRAAMEILSSYTNTYGNLVIDYNLYYQNGWRESLPGSQLDIYLYRDNLPVLKLRGLTSIRRKTDWEDHGIQADPNFEGYDAGDHTLYQYPEYTFVPTIQSDAIIDKGSLTVSNSLTKLLNKYLIINPLCGNSYEIGRFEYCE